MPKKPMLGPYIIIDTNAEPLRDTAHAVREFSTIARATRHLRPDDKVVPPADARSGLMDISVGDRAPRRSGLKPR